MHTDTSIAIFYPIKNRVAPRQHPEHHVSRNVLEQHEQWSNVELTLVDWWFYWSKFVYAYKADGYEGRDMYVYIHIHCIY